jgi:predicted metalloprotease with PDZ domain
MNDNYAKKGLFFPDSDGVQQAAETITGQSFAEFFHDFVAGVPELPYSDFFGFVGLQVAEATTRVVTPGFETTSFLGSQPEVLAVDAGSDAARAGITVGDRIVEMNGTAAPAPFDEQVARMREGSTIKIRVANRHGQRNLKLKLTGHSEQVYILQDFPNISPEQRVHREAWIHGNDEAGGEP